MNKWELFQKFLITQEEQIQTTDFLINAGLIIILTIILELTYRKCGKTLSNRRMFAGNFILLGFTTMLIISIVKSSLALSLGLVGALSIVRFRAAIKEPEELAYLFFTIATGLGLGANMRLITTVAFLIMIALIWIRYVVDGKVKTHNLFFTVTGNAAEVNLTKISEVVTKYFGMHDLKRFDEQDEKIEASFMIEATKTDSIEQCKKELQEVSKNIRVSFIDSKNY